MRRRLHRRIEALRDGALAPRRARLAREQLESDPEAARVLRRTEALGRAIHDSWTEGPPGPDPEALVERLRPGLARIDRELAERCLQSISNVEVRFAEDGGQALQAVDLESLDLVLTDLRMPGMTGIELVETLRARFPQLPVILMTSQGSER